MIYAIMDIGSNTVRLSVYKQVEDKAVHLFSEKEQASLRNYVKKEILQIRVSIDLLLP